MITILRYFLRPDERLKIAGSVVAPIEGGKQRCAFFEAKGGLVPSRGDVLNLNLPKSHIRTFDPFDYDRYAGTFRVVSVEQTPVFDSWSDEAAEMPRVIETIVNVTLARLYESDA